MKRFRKTFCYLTAWCLTAERIPLADDGSRHQRDTQPNIIWSLGKDCRIQRGRRQEVNMATESTKQGSKELRETEVTITEPLLVCARSFAYMLWLFSLGFGGNSKSGSWDASFSFIIFSSWTALYILDLMVCGHF